MKPTKREILSTLQVTIAINSDPKLARDYACSVYQKAKKCVLNKHDSKKFKRSIKNTDLKDFIDYDTNLVFKGLREAKDLAVLVVLQAGLRAIWEESPFVTIGGTQLPEKKLNLFLKKLEDFFCEIAGIQRKEDDHGKNRIQDDD